MRRTHARLAFGTVCRWLGHSRQTFYCAEGLARKRAFEMTLILKFVLEARQRAGAKLGTKKLRRLIAEPLARAQIRCGRDQLFAHLITVAYSRMVVRVFVSATMHADYTVKALERVLQGRLYPNHKLCHHSDRGSQYRAEIYTLTLATTDAGISMT